MWIVAQTKLKKEEFARYNLENQGFETYLPKVKVKKFTLTRWVDREQILFPRYIFINIEGNFSKIGCLNYTKGISKLIIDNDTGMPLEVKAPDIAAIKETENDINFNTLKEGTKAFITKGSTSMKVTFLKKKRNNKALVIFKLLNSEYKISVDLANLQYSY